METHCVNLNIHYTAPQAVWEKIDVLYREMPGWQGYIADGCPQWYGAEGKLIEASVEPSGLQFYAELPAAEWEAWITCFKNKATKLLGYEIGEPEDGFEFR